MPRIMARACFGSMSAALEAVDALERAGLEVAIADELIDVYSAAAFVEITRDIDEKRADILERVGKQMIKLVDELGGCVSDYGYVPPDLPPFEYETSYWRARRQ
jgi:hypothetical protein